MLAYIYANAEAFIESLETLIQKITPKETYDTDVFEDIEFLKEQLAIIKTACEDYDDTTVYTVLNKLKETKWRKETTEFIEELHYAIYLNSDFEKVINKIESFYSLTNA